MPVHIGEMVTEVVATGEPGSGPQGEGTSRESGWKARERIRAGLERMAMDRLRTRAEAFSD